MNTAGKCSFLSVSQALLFISPDQWRVGENRLCLLSCWPTKQQHNPDLTFYFSNLWLWNKVMSLESQNTSKVSRYDKCIKICLRPKHDIKMVFKQCLRVSGRMFVINVFCSLGFSKNVLFRHCEQVRCGGFLENETSHIKALLTPLCLN